MHEIIVDTYYITSGESFDQILTDILHYFKPRVLAVRGGLNEKIYQNTKVQFRVPELTIDDIFFMPESILSKVIPTHSLRIFGYYQINLS